MTGKELLERFNLGEKLTVKFIKEIENGSSCSQWEDGMMADVIDVWIEKNIVSIEIDSKKYIDFNKSMQKPIWYNSKTGKYDATRDEFLSNEEDSETYEDVFWIRENGKIVNMIIG